MTTQANDNTVINTSAAAQARTGALIALFLGGFMVFTVGFAFPMVIHNAAHDTRHSMAFPCH